MNDKRRHIASALHALAVADAMTWQAIFHRSTLLPYWTRRIRREIEAESETSHVVSLSMPFSLNQPPESLSLSPTDDTEWAAFEMNILLGSKESSYLKTAMKDWHDLAQEERPVRGSVSIQSTLFNLRRGQEPPASGRDNPHHNDDGAMIRALVIGLACAGQPEKASETSALDSSITNAEDGIWCAKAIAVLASLSVEMLPTEKLIQRTIQELPNGTWSRHLSQLALEIVGTHDSFVSAYPSLSERIINKEYNYGCMAAENLALVLAILSLTERNTFQAISAGLSFGKVSDSVAPLIAAIVGAIDANAFAFEEWKSIVQTLKGVCIPGLSGLNYLELVENFSLHVTS
jgi:ADP-ribosylglycohydrolase